MAAIILLCEGCQLLIVDNGNNTRKNATNGSTVIKEAK